MAEQFDPSMTTVHVTNEVPTGTYDGTNTSFTLANQPAAGGVDLYLSGVKLVPTVDYTLSGKTLTMVKIPQADDYLYANYWF